MYIAFQVSNWQPILLLHLALYIYWYGAKLYTGIMYYACKQEWFIKHVHVHVASNG